MTANPLKSKYFRLELQVLREEGEGGRKSSDKNAFDLLKLRFLQMFAYF